jgi:hypothetical protein
MEREQWPFYEFSKYSDIQAKILKEERPYVDDRLRNKGFVERNLVKLMERMWEHNPEDRPTIFQVVTFLSRVQAMAQNASAA